MANCCVAIGIIISEIIAAHIFSNLKFQLCQEDQKAAALQVVAAATAVVNHKEV